MGIKFFLLSSAASKNNKPMYNLIKPANNLLKDPGMTQLLILLSQPSMLPSLQHLYISGNEIRDAGMLQFPSLKYCNLQQLDLSINYIGTCGMKLLVKAQLLKLISLSIMLCLGGTQGWKVVGKKGYWPKLQSLDLSDNYAKFDGYLAICNQGYYPSLNDLTIAFTHKDSDPIQLLHLMQIQSNITTPLKIHHRTQKIMRNMSEFIQKRLLF